MKRKNNDTYKKTEWMLYNYKMLKVSVENLKSEIQELKMDTVGTGAIRYDREKTSPTYNIVCTTEEEAIANIERISKLEKQIMKTQNKIDKIDRGLSALNEEERTIIESRYIKGLQWWQVAGIVKYSERWCREKRKGAIEKMAIGLFGDTSVLVPHFLGKRLYYCIIKKLPKTIYDN
ncbi:sigma-70 RNA polymerase sigma factor region 4 domain-containing protein [Tepidibacter mesophilus]|uniref:sigma-70 family RNA polymerase sigma factor n=1 Tax=Tepidibacter mesophilus TaxID=655607 RepID=UPI000C07A253|nr:sigma-70 family RNA polymerase sigma factor [Tepidibacter mesophilus]